mgnify:CR=1 FL=1
MGVRRVRKPSRKAEPGMNTRIWVAITAHNPMSRINSLFNVLNEYMKYPYDLNVRIYIDYDSQNDIELLGTTLEPYKKLNIDIIVAAPEYENWYLTWAHKNDLALAILNKKADFYIYQENDTLISIENFQYWRVWRPRLAFHGLEPGFMRYEVYKDQKVPFDNHHIFSLTRETPDIWSDQGFTVPKILVIDREIDFFVQVASPYYGGMILNQEDGENYIRSMSFDRENSYARLGSRLVTVPLTDELVEKTTDKAIKEHLIGLRDKGSKFVSYPLRNWPVADRSSMGVAFENIPAGFEHRRCIPLVKEGDNYVPHMCGLVRHDDNKYAPALLEREGIVLDCKKMFTLH